MKSVTSNECKIYYSAFEKEGVMALLVNGYTRTHSDFKALGNFLLDQGIGSLALDNRGAGKSVASESFTLEEMAHDLLSIIEHEHLDKVHLVGISMGGLISQLFASMFPHLVDKLVLVSTTYTSDQIQGGNHRWPEDEEAIYEKMTGYFSRDFVERNKILIKAMTKNILKTIESGDFLQQSEWQHQAIKEARIDGIQGAITCPTLILHGSEDAIIPFENATQLQSKIGNSILKRFEGSGHLLIAERSKELYQEIYNFISP